MNAHGDVYKNHGILLKLFPFVYKFSIMFMENDKV